MPQRAAETREGRGCLMTAKCGVSHGIRYFEAAGSRSGLGLPNDSLDLGLALGQQPMTQGRVKVQYARGQTEPKIQEHFPADRNFYPPMPLNPHNLAI